MDQNSTVPAVHNDVDKIVSDIISSNFSQVIFSVKKNQLDC